MCDCCREQNDVIRLQKERKFTNTNWTRSSLGRVESETCIDLITIMLITIKLLSLKRAFLHNSERSRLSTSPCYAIYVVCMYPISLFESIEQFYRNLYKYYAVGS